MDGNKSEIKPGNPLPLEDRVFRYGKNTNVDKANKYKPSLNFFELTGADKATGYGLSVDWEKLTTPEKTIARIGGTYIYKTEKFKEFKDKVIYAIEIEFLKSLKGVNSITYNPSNLNNKKLGSPSNPSHSIIKFDETEYDQKQNRVEILTEIRNHAKDKKIEVDMNEVEKLVKELRK